MRSRSSAHRSRARCGSRRTTDEQQGPCGERPVGCSSAYFPGKGWASVTVTSFVLSPLFKVSRLDRDARPTLHAGSGDVRSHLALTGSSAPHLIEWLLSCTTPRTTEELIGCLRQRFGCGQDIACGIVEEMTESRVLVPGDEGQSDRHASRWGPYGWRDAADFHVATFGLRFVPDEVDGLSYADYFAAMMKDTESAGPQPAAAAFRGTFVAEPAAGTDEKISMQEVLDAAEPINRFIGRPVTHAEFLPPLQRAFGVQRRVAGLLGEHHLRSFPSGGARHPFELYLLSKGLDDLPAGVYHFDAVAGRLSALPEHGDVLEIDRACFGKGGILSAAAVVVLTCRWLRHSWKYRYARSYRMLMLEVGHIVQAINLSMIANGLAAYHCPSIDDRLLREILATGDDCAEGPVYALGLGHGGVR